MVSSSATVGIAVGIPCGAVLVALFLMWYIFSKRNRDRDLEDPTELDADLTFENYRELAGVQSRNDQLHQDGSGKLADSNHHNKETDSFDDSAEDTANDNTRSELTKDVKPPKYRKYTHHSQQFSMNNNIIGNNNSLDSISEPNSHFAQSQMQMSQEDLKRNSEKLFQDYFDGVIPMVINPSDHHNDLSASSNVTDAVSVNNKDDNAGRSSPKLLNFPYVGTSSLKLSSSNHSMVHQENSSILNATSNQNNSLLKSDSNNNSEANLLKSLAINLHNDSSHDFQMPIPGSARTSMLNNQNNKNTYNSNNSLINRRISIASQNTATTSNSFANNTIQLLDNHSSITETFNYNTPKTPQKISKNPQLMLPQPDISNSDNANVFATPPQSKPAHSHPYHEISSSNKKLQLAESDAEDIENTTIVDTSGANTTEFSTSTSNNENENSFVNGTDKSILDKEKFPGHGRALPTPPADSSNSSAVSNIYKFSNTDYSSSSNGKTGDSNNNINSYSYYAVNHSDSVNDNGFFTPRRKTPDLKKQSSYEANIHVNENISNKVYPDFTFDNNTEKVESIHEKNIFGTPTSQNGSFMNGIGTTPGDINEGPAANDDEMRRNPFDF